MRWLNDYGDPPRWYFSSSCFRRPRRRRGPGRAALIAAATLAAWGL